MRLPCPYLQRSLPPEPHRARSRSRNFRPLALPLLLCLLSLLSACQTDPRLRRDLPYLGGFSAKDEARAHFDNYSHWDGEGVPGAPRILIRLGEQRAYFYKGEALVGVASISTGREGFGTPTGSFRIQQKDRHHASSLYGDYVDASGKIVLRDIDRKKDPMPPGTRFDGAKMPFFMRIHGGVGLHEGFLPGEPASHGCIRMTRGMAEAFFRNVEVGTPVTIQP